MGIEHDDKNDARYLIKKDNALKDRVYGVGARQGVGGLHLDLTLDDSEYP